MATAASAEGMTMKLAVSLLAQRQLVVDDLEAIGYGGAEAVLDQASAATSPAIALCGPTAGYVRDLQRQRPLPPQHLPERLLIPLPVRIVDRLLAGDRYRGLDPAQLDQARAWELASALRGRTMAEWAILVIASEGRPAA